MVDEPADRTEAAAHDEIRFGGAPTAARSGDERVETQTAVRAIEAAFTSMTADPSMRELYGDPERGATLAQAWRARQLLGVAPAVCLVVAGRNVRTDGIDTVVVATAQQFVRTLAAVLESEARAAVQLFTFDGRTGHCVTAHATDPAAAGVIFHDPWPGDSLLAASQNAIGVSATRVGELWRLTSTELETVAVAAFISPGVWAELTGKPGRPTVEQVRSSDFWSFFGIHEVARDDADPTHVRLELQTGGFAEHLRLSLRHGEADRITSAELSIRGSWLVGPPWGINPFANDLAASWLATFVPPDDRDLVAPLVETIRELRAGPELEAKLRSTDWLDSEQGRMVTAYTGLSEQPFTAVCPLSVMRIGKDDLTGDPWTTLRLAIG